MTFRPRVKIIKKEKKTRMINCGDLVRKCLELGAGVYIGRRGGDRWD